MATKKQQAEETPTPAQVYLEESELSTLRNFTNQDNFITNDFGVVRRLRLQLDEREQNLVQSLTNLNQQRMAFLRQLEEKYGVGNIDLDQGLFIPSKGN